jgi:hypothetical protein
MGVCLILCNENSSELGMIIEMLLCFVDRRCYDAHILRNSAQLYATYCWPTKKDAQRRGS